MLTWKVKRTMDKKCNGLRVAVAVGFVSACSANAQTDLLINIDTAYQGTIAVAGAPGPLGTGEGVYLTAFQATYNGGDALPFPTPNPFITFCIDILPDLQNNNNGTYSGSWTAGTFPLQGNQNGNTLPYVNGGIQRAASLYNHYVGDASIGSGGGDGMYSGQQYGAALQLAIWSVLYGNSFSASGVDSQITTLEGAILGSQYNFADPNLTSTFWNATDPSNNQDLIGPQMQTGSVPEPATYAAATSACALLGLLGIRRKQAHI